MTRQKKLVVRYMYTNDVTTYLFRIEGVISTRVYINPELCTRQTNSGHLILEICHPESSWDHVVQ